jgi:hypothetical protein
MTDDAKNQKKAYEPPRVTVVSLRPEEAVLGHCKSNSSAGPVGSNCQGGGPACRGNGS